MALPSRVRLITRFPIWHVICLLGMALSVYQDASGQPVPPARDWTVLVYMNGKNSLEQAELDNFDSLAKVGSSGQVAVVAELGRPQRHNKSAEGWSGVYRFYIQQGTRPISKDKVMDVAATGESTDMGRPLALTNFIRWAKTNYPAHRYMLIICNHGQGWRLELANSASKLSEVADHMGVGRAIQVPPESGPLGGFRAVSKDDDTGSILFNREIEDALLKEFGPKGLSILGFDACLMAMTETAYEFEPSTQSLIGSEELEPSNGWNYSEWMKTLLARPMLSNADIGHTIVDSYQHENGNEYFTTLSAVDLTDFRKDISGLSRLSDAIIAAGPSEISNIRVARTKLKSYGDWWSPPSYTSVDLITLLDRFEGITTNQSLRTQSAALRRRLSEHLIANYASTRSADANHNPYGSQGIAIYFPESSKVFFADQFHRGYVKSNADRPVEFVKNERWSDLLYQVLSIK